MSLGVLLVLIRVPIPAVGSFSLGPVGGPLLVPVGGAIVIGHTLFKMSTDDLFGVVSGTTNNPAILKIVCVQVAIGVFGG